MQHILPGLIAVTEADGNCDDHLTRDAEGNTAANRAVSRDPRLNGKQGDSDFLSLLGRCCDGILLLDTEGRVRGMNDGACALFGCGAEDIDRWPFDLLFARESRRTVADCVESLLAERKATSLEAIGRTATGARLPLSLSLAPLSGADGFCVILAGAPTGGQPSPDLSVSTDGSAGARRALRLLRRFSHDIRTPLNSIIGFATLISEDEGSEEGLSRHTAYGRDIVEAGSQLLETALDHIALLETVVRGADIDRQPIGLNAVIRDELVEIKRKSIARCVIVRESLAETLPRALADAGSVSTMLSLVAQRAIEVTPPYGQIFIATRLSEAGDPVLCIRDGGERLALDQVAELMSLNEDARPDVDVASVAGSQLLKRAMVLAEINGARLRIGPLPGGGNVTEVIFRSGAKE